MLCTYLHYLQQQLNLLHKTANYEVLRQLGRFLMVWTYLHYLQQQLYLLHETAILPLVSLAKHVHALPYLQVLDKDTA